jgi:hypothetical protein
VFVTLLGPLPRPPLADDAPPEALLDAVLALQDGHGLEPLTGAGWGDWATASARTERLVKGVIDGPTTHDRPLEAVRVDVLRLVDAGCAWIEVHESMTCLAAGADDALRARFAEDHVALTDGLAGVHLSLALTGGSAEGLGTDALLAGAYASYAFDLRDGPDSWRVVTGLPGERGVIAGAVSADPAGDDSPELMLWAVGYAASTGGRGVDRVGLATAGSLAALTWDEAVRKVTRLGEVGRLAAASVDERRAAIDPRAVDKRSAALGRYEPRSRKTGAADRPDAADPP